MSWIKQAFAAYNQRKITKAVKKSLASIDIYAGELDQYIQHNIAAAGQAPKPIQYNARLQHRKNKSQRKNWGKWKQRR